MKTPPASVDVAAWIGSLSAQDAAYIHGVAFRWMAVKSDITEADLYRDFADRAAKDPDCQGE